MFSLAYVILPFGSASPAAAIAASLARFQRGRRGDIPEQWLRFHDETAHVEELYRSSLTFTKGQGLRTEGADPWYFDIRAIMVEMDRRGLLRWDVRFADIEPTIATFVTKYLCMLERHPITGGFGQWLNPLGQWDWWDLGGRFDGVITGAKGGSGRTRCEISSGPSRGRDVLAGVEDALGDALGQTPLPQIDVSTDANVEVVSRLREDLEQGDVRLPGALVLPPGSVADEMRWIANWPEIGPLEALDWFDLTAEAHWRDIVRAALGRFDDHWAAGVAFHH